jgi:toxin ParE1/3/4
MSHCDFTPQAAEDLREIARYTLATWGVAQARHYRHELEFSLKKLSLAPTLRPVREKLGPIVRSYVVGSQVAYYVVAKSGIAVVRVVHQSMDVAEAFEAGAKEAGVENEEMKKWWAV